MSFWKPKVNVTVNCEHNDTTPQPPPDRRRHLVWIEPDGTLVVSDKFAKEFPAPVTSWDTPPKKIGAVLERDASIRAWRYIPVTQSMAAAAKIVRAELASLEEDYERTND